MRELRNILERAAILCDGGLITAEHLALKVRPRQAPATPASASIALGHPRTAPATPAAPVHRTAPHAPVAPVAPAAPVLARDLQAMERTMVEQALAQARFNKSKAAKALGLTRAQLYVRLKRYGLE